MNDDRWEIWDEKWLTWKANVKESLVMRYNRFKMDVKVWWIKIKYKTLKR